MEVEVTLRAIITLPEGSKRSETEHRGWVLPDGSVVKPFVVLELNDDHDMDYAECLTHDVEIDNYECIFEEE